MRFIIYSALIALIVFMLLYFMPIKIKLKTIRKNSDDVMLIRIKTLYGIVNLKFEIPFLDIVFINNKLALKYKAQIESNRTSKLWRQINKIFSAEDFNNIKKYFRHDPVLLKKLNSYWSKVLTIEDFSFILKYGFSDAALVALLYGAACTILGVILAIMDNNLKFSTKDIIVKPYFDRDVFNIEFSCIIKFKFGNIINTGIMVLKRRRQRKESKTAINNILNAS